MGTERTLTSRLVDVALGFVIWFLCVVAMGFAARVMWETALLGWNLL